jgi:CheY-like chemotaxis protein
MLNGTTVLVVEEEFLIALDIQRILENLGASQILFARNAQEAQTMDAYWPDVRLAIVDIALEQQGSLHLIDHLTRTGIPVVICSADTGLRHGVSQFPSLPVVAKPMAETDMVTAISQVFNLAG